MSNTTPDHSQNCLNPPKGDDVSGLQVTRPRHQTLGGPHARGAQNCDSPMAMHKSTSNEKLYLIIAKNCACQSARRKARCEYYTMALRAYTTLRTHLEADWVLTLLDHTPNLAGIGTRLLSGHSIKLHPIYEELDGAQGGLSL